MYESGLYSDVIDRMSPLSDDKIQMAWLAIQMGWKELVVISGQNGEGTGNASTVRINGKSVFHQEDHPYLSAEAYANEAADVNCAYALSFNKR